MSIVFGGDGKQERTDTKLFNNLGMSIAAGALAIVLGWYIRQYDWLSTSMYFDAQGFNLVSSSTRVFVGNVVSEESFWLNISMWLGSIVFYYNAYISGPVITVSYSIWLEGDAKKRWDWINWNTLISFSCAIALSITDSHIDFMWKLSSGSGSALQAFFISYVYYGLLSEFMFGLALKVGFTAMGRCLGISGFWQMIGWGQWAVERGLIDKDSLKRATKTIKKNTSGRNKSRRNTNQPQQRASHSRPDPRNSKVDRMGRPISGSSQSRQSPQTMQSLADGFVNEFANDIDGQI